MIRGSHQFPDLLCHRPKFGNVACLHAAPRQIATLLQNPKASHLQGAAVVVPHAVCQAVYRHEGNLRAQRPCTQGNAGFKRGVQRKHGCAKLRLSKASQLRPVG